MRLWTGLKSCERDRSRSYACHRSGCGPRRYCNEMSGWALMSLSAVMKLVYCFLIICAGRIEKGTMPENPVAVKSIVSTPLADAVAAHYGVELRNVLTGFKWIGDQIAQLEEAGEVDRFIFGFEESYGYLAGPYVRDKDAVIGSMLICEMAAYQKYRKLP